MDKLKFVPFITNVSPSFWYKLVDLKLNKFKLDDSSQNVHGSYSNITMLANNEPCQHSVDFDAFDEGMDKQQYFVTHGKLFNKNTVEEFKKCDKKDILSKAGQDLWSNIMEGKAIKNPSLLVTFVLITFADLKKYNFHYWFGYPSFIQNYDLTILKQCPIVEIKSYSFSFDDSFIKYTTSSNFKQFFLIQSYEYDTVTFHSLEEFDSLPKNRISFGYIDPSPMKEYPGWPLRNFLLLILVHWAKHLNDNIINIYCLRLQKESGVANLKQSLYVQVKCSTINTSQIPEATGWERNAHGKLTSKYVNLAETMDPVKLAESSTSLNLRLMKWRLLPNIDLDKISNLKCLLMGAGTLGCNVSRSLLAWGVRHITFVDNGTVSFSNPVRQTLFEFSDCKVAGGVYKAVAAAEKLKKIYPGIVSHGFVLNVPMPGHPVNSSEKYFNQAKNDTAKIIELIQQHDIIFLLTDSRESRWLPTLVANAESKLVITAALGFDSYLVMRHGMVNKSTPQSSEEGKLGCYFCNDVVAPGNSLRDRTLDQQCTVSRPGLSLIASALAVELCVSVMQHPDQANYKPPMMSDDLDSNPELFPLGYIPHQIRGFLSQFKTLLPSTMAFTKCTACCDEVTEAYNDGKLEFLMKVFNSPSNYLEDLTGLTDLHKETSFADILEFSDSESI